MHSSVEQITAKPPALLRPQLRDVVREHLEEYAFLSMMRRTTLFDPERVLSQLKRLENRLEAHWDGLVVGCPLSLDVALGKIKEAGDHWDTYAALRVWFALGDPTTEEIAGQLAEVEEAGLPPWREAFCRCPQERITALLPDDLLGHVAPSVQSTALFALGWHNVLPQGQSERLVQHQNPLIRYCLARTLAWGAFATDEAEQLLALLCTDEDRIIQRAALWSAAMTHPIAAAEKCRSSLEQGDLDPFTVKMLGLIGSPADMAILLQSAEQEVLAGDAVKALGHLGSTQGVAHLLQFLEDEKVAGQAALALETLLGPMAQQLIDLAEPEARQDSWQQLRNQYAGSETICHGFPVPWQREPHAEPLPLHWRRMILQPSSSDNWIKKEIPNDFFTMTGDDVPIPGM